MVEVGFRAFYPQRLGVWHHDREGLVLHWPGVATYLPEFGLRVSFDSAGMRDQGHPVEKPVGRGTILGLRLLRTEGRDGMSALVTHGNFGSALAVTRSLGCRGAAAGPGGRSPVEF